MKNLAAGFLVLTLVLRETPAAAAAPDLGEARRRFVAAVHASDQAVAAAEAAVEDAIAKAGTLERADAERQREALGKLRDGLRTFKAAKAQILARKIATSQELMREAEEYARTYRILAAIILAVVAIVVTVVASVAAAPVYVVAAAAVCAALVNLTATLVASLPEVSRAVSEVLRASGFQGAADSADAVAQWMAKNMGVTLAVAQALAAVITTIADARGAMSQANAAARDAQAKLQALPKPPAAPPVLTSFDGYLGSSFAVHLDNGNATVGSAEATLEGGVTISPKSDPSLKLSVSGRVVLRVRPGSSSGPAGSAIDQTTFRATVLGAGPQIATWASLEGQGSVRITGFGPAGITIPRAALASESSRIMLTGGEASLRGCTHTLAAGSGFLASQVRLEGSLRCGPWSLTASSMGIDKAGVSGGGTLSAWSKSFTMSYAASGDGLVARGSLSGADTPWNRVPGFEAEYRIEAPKLDLKLDGPALSPTFGAGKVNVRTTAKRPDGNPWASASLAPDVIMVPAPPTDGIPVPFPVLPAPSDVEKAARDACEAGARRTLAGKALQAALDVCRSGHPSPPAVPTLPRSISLKVGDVFR